MHAVVTACGNAVAGHQPCTVLSSNGQGETACLRAMAREPPSARPWMAGLDDRHSKGLAMDGNDANTEVLSFNGQDAALSTRRRGFDSRQDRH